MTQYIAIIALILCMIMAMVIAGPLVSGNEMVGQVHVVYHTLCLSLTFLCVLLVDIGGNHCEPCGNANDWLLRSC